MSDTPELTDDQATTIRYDLLFVSNPPEEELARLEAYDAKKRKEIINAAIAPLREAMTFYDLCLKSKMATETGAMRDAHQGVIEAVRDLIAKEKP